MIEWLKTSILGMVLLGALGSVLAVFVIAACRPLIARTATSTLIFFHKPRLAAEHFRKSADVRKLVVSCAFLLGAAISFGTLSLTTFGLLYLGVLLRVPTKPYGQVFVFSTSFVGFTALLCQFRAIWYISSIYSALMDTTEKKINDRTQAEVSNQVKLERSTPSR